MSDLLNFEELKTEGLLPSPQGVALTLMHQLQKADVSLPDLVHTILTDPALSGQVIKLANAANPNKNRPIASVTVDTLLIIGTQALRQLVIGLSMSSSYRMGKCSAFDYSNYWSYSTAMACAAQRIGMHVRIVPLPEIFACGLLAEIGQLVLATVRPEAYAELLMQYSSRSLKDLMHAESNRFDMGRRALTAAMMAEWGMPQIFIDAVSFYDQPDSAGFAPKSRQQKLARALMLAGKMATLYTSPENTWETSLPELIEAGALLDFNEDQVVSIANQAAKDWKEWTKLLHLKSKVVNLHTRAEKLNVKGDEA